MLESVTFFVREKDYEGETVYIYPDGEIRELIPVCTENLSSGVVVVKSAKDGV